MSLTMITVGTTGSEIFDEMEYQGVVGIKPLHLDVSPVKALPKTSEDFKCGLDNNVSQDLDRSCSPGDKVIIICGLDQGSVSSFVAHIAHHLFFMEVIVMIVSSSAMTIEQSDEEWTTSWRDWITEFSVSSFEMFYEKNADQQITSYLAVLAQMLLLADPKENLHVIQGSTCNECELYADEIGSQFSFSKRVGIGIGKSGSLEKSFDLALKDLNMKGQARIVWVSVVHPIGDSNRDQIVKIASSNFKDAVILVSVSASFELGSEYTLAILTGDRSFADVVEQYDVQEE